MGVPFVDHSARDRECDAARALLTERCPDEDSYVIQSAPPGVEVPWRRVLRVLKPMLDQIDEDDADRAAGRPVARGGLRALARWSACDVYMAIDRAFKEGWEDEDAEDEDAPF